METTTVGYKLSKGFSRKIVCAVMSFIGLIKFAWLDGF